MKHQELYELLERKYQQFNTSAFIDDDPVCIPHEFSQKEDIEIAGFFAATFAWGQRITIINKCKELMNLMDWAPHDFVLNHSNIDLERLTNFKHRTFNFVDLTFFIKRLKQAYLNEGGLETLFSKGNSAKERLTNFELAFKTYEGFETRTGKHIATPARKSTCKRLNMYLRWMVRDDKGGVDLGIWKRISPKELMCPFDVHVERVSRSLGLLKRKQRDWQAVEELTENLRKFDPEDPVKYDYALFGLGILEKVV
ncbi:MAG: TIGR02757 family protein [Bacteroidia bacterium]